MKPMIRLSPSGTRSLPEHTVDCWVSSAISGAIPDALIWAPTQRGSDNWDVAYAHSPGKSFVLENKGTSNAQSKVKPDNHVIDIDVSQLFRYLHTPGPPVYYVLPVPPWPARASISTLTTASPIPAAAFCRTGQACANSAHRKHGPFPTWAYVVEALDLAKYLLGAGFEIRRPWTFDASAVAKIAKASRLDAFLAGVVACTHGGTRHESSDQATADWNAAFQERRGIVADIERGFQPRQTSAVGAGALAVFVPLLRDDR
ncbi:hypothetical protein AB0B31_25545 [Catellatospora citrea]|uniref:hypothetical protein n=1 Tax=Catellatospora citrea TaxID=53366 RepID=UPI0033F80297